MALNPCVSVNDDAGKYQTHAKRKPNETKQNEGVKMFDSFF